MSLRIVAKEPYKKRVLSQKRLKDLPSWRFVGSSTWQGHGSQTYRAQGQCATWETYCHHDFERCSFKSRGQDDIGDGIRQDDIRLIYPSFGRIQGIFDGMIAPRLPRFCHHRIQHALYSTKDHCVLIPSRNEVNMTHVSFGRIYTHRIQGALEIAYWCEGKRVRAGRAPMIAEARSTWNIRFYETWLTMCIWIYVTANCIW